MPPVMYSHAWSPAPSTTATAPELRTANRSPGAAGAVQLAAGGAVERRVADENRVAQVAGRGTNDDAAAAHRLPDRVVRVTRQRELDTRSEERAEALPGAAAEPRAHAAGRRRLAEAVRDLSAQTSADGAIARLDRVVELDDARLFERRPRICGETVSELAAGQVELRLAGVPSAT